MYFLQNIIYNIIYKIIVKVSKKQLKVVDIVEEKNDIKHEEEGEKNNDVEELINIKQEIEN